MHRQNLRRRAGLLLFVILFSLTGCVYNEYMRIEQGKFAENTRKNAEEEQRRQDLLLKRQELESQIKAMEHDIDLLNKEYAATTASIAALQQQNKRNQSALAKQQKDELRLQQIKKAIKDKQSVVTEKKQRLDRLIDQNM
ncbi:hypothetical protein [Solidesulfovibrio sp.]|uniref:hypothetical protein n=1 Tax=Solidesulfovibrio sp. TaxID=2910990 RepID=UPI0026156FDD|nr:hypothetical protein [Solidesulfovibrio sp.]